MNEEQKSIIEYLIKSQHLFKECFKDMGKSKYSGKSQEMYGLLRGFSSMERIFDNQISELKKLQALLSTKEAKPKKIRWETLTTLNYVDWISRLFHGFFFTTLLTSQAISPVFS